eukprot:gene3917-2785_t
MGARETCRGEKQDEPPLSFCAVSRPFIIIIIIIISPGSLYTRTANLRIYVLSLSSLRLLELKSKRGARRGKLEKNSTTRTKEIPTVTIKRRCSAAERYGPKIERKYKPIADLMRLAARLSSLSFLLDLEEAKRGQADFFFDSCFERTCLNRERYQLGTRIYHKTTLHLPQKVPYAPFLHR